MTTRRRRPAPQRRLPGRRRIVEVARSPLPVLRAKSPARIRRAWRPPTADRLVGLLLIRDEDDVVPDVLDTAVQWFDRILVLDGTVDTDRRDRTRRILAARPEVVHYVTDGEALGGRPATDSARQVLLDEARRRYGLDQWIGILHGDEFIDQDPRPLLASLNPATAPTVRVRLVHTFLHRDDSESWHERETLPIRARVRHAMWPGVPETRFFFDRGDRDYVPGHHSKTVPTSFRSGPLIDGFCVTQYNERTPQQAIARAEQRIGSNWQTAHYTRFQGSRRDVFVDTLDDPPGSFAPEFRDDPAGPFAPACVDGLPIGPLVGDPRPQVTDTTRDTDGTRTVDLSWVARPAGLLAQAERTTARATTAAAALERTLPSVAVGTAPLAEYVVRILRSRRVSAAGRQRVLNELVRRLHDDGQPWIGLLAHEPARRARHVLGDSHLRWTP